MSACRRHCPPSLTSSAHQREHKQLQVGLFKEIGGKILKKWCKNCILMMIVLPQQEDPLHLFNLSLGSSLFIMSRFLGIILIVALMHCASAFRATMPSNRGGLRLSKLSMAAKEAFQLVLIRHGESSWNKVIF